MSERSIEWTGDLDDDCTAIWYQFMLRAEEMDTHVWWWAVYDRDRDHVQVDCSNNCDRPAPRTGEEARQVAEGVLVPTNTECIVSGAAETAINVIQSRRNSKERDIFDELFGLRIKDLPDRKGERVYIDFKVRDPVGRLGDAVISKSLRQLNLELETGWERVLLAYVRSQSTPPDFRDNLSRESVEQSLKRALDLASVHGIRSLVSVPFGTGLSGLTLNQSAGYMIPTIAEHLRSKDNCQKQVLIVEAYLEKYLQFTDATAELLGKGRSAL